MSSILVIPIHCTDSIKLLYAENLLYVKNNNNKEDNSRHDVKISIYPYHHLDYYLQGISHG